VTELSHPRVLAIAATLFAASSIGAQDVVLPLEVQRPPAALAELHVTDSHAALTAVREAIAAGDLTGFDAALGGAQSLADSMAVGEERNSLRRALLVYGDVQRLWHYSSSDRFGAFYDDEALPGFYDHLTADYRGFAAYIDEQRIDAKGRVLYPTAETRKFLLRQIEEPVQIARAAVKKKPLTPAPLPARRGEGTVKPIVVRASEPAPVDALAADMHNAASLPPLPQSPVEPQQQVAQARIIDNGAEGRGIFFLILALVGFGVLATMVRTPPESTPPHI